MTRKFQLWVFFFALFSLIIIGKSAFAGQPEINKQFQEAKTLKDFENLSKTIQQFLDENPEQIEMLWQLARTHFHIAKHTESKEIKINNYTQCIQRTDQAIELKPNSAISYFFQAICIGMRENSKDWWEKSDIREDFRQKINKALELDRTIENGGPNRALGYFYMRLPLFWKDLNKSISNFQEAIKLSPGFAENHLGLAEAFKENNDFDSARNSIHTLMHLTDNAGDDDDLLKFRKEGQELMKEMTP